MGFFVASAGVAKWTTAPVLKTGSHPGPWVRIPFPAPFLLSTGGKIEENIFLCEWVGMCVNVSLVVCIMFRFLVGLIRCEEYGY